MDGRTLLFDGVVDLFDGRGRFNAGFFDLRNDRLNLLRTLYPLLNIINALPDFLRNLFGYFVDFLGFRSNGSTAVFPKDAMTDSSRCSRLMRSITLSLGMVDSKRSNSMISDVIAE